MQSRNKGRTVGPRRDRSSQLGNAAFHLLAARLLGPSQYSEIVSLVAVAGLISLPFGGIQFVVARFVAVDATTGDTARMGAFIRRAVIATAIVAAALSVVLTIASPLLQNALGVGGLTPVVLTTLYTLPALLAPTFWGVAQGLQRFGLLSASMVAGTFVRIGIVVALIPFGIGVGGVMGATLVTPSPHCSSRCRSCFAYGVGSDG